MTNQKLKILFLLVQLTYIPVTTLISLKLKSGSEENELTLLKQIAWLNLFQRRSNRLVLFSEC